MHCILCALAGCMVQCIEPKIGVCVGVGGPG